MEVITAEAKSAPFAVEATESAPISQTHQVVQSAGIVSAAVLLSRFSGLAREMVMAYVFGAGFAHDAFLLGFRIPNLSRDLLGEGAFSSAFVPTFTTSLANTREDAQELARQVTSALIVGVGLLCLFGMLFAPGLVDLLAPGFHSEPGKFQLAVHLSRIMFPFLLIIALSSQATCMLNAQGSFGIPATASIFFNIGAVGIGLLLGYVIGPSIHLSKVVGMAYGILAGGLFQLAWQLPRLRGMGFTFRPAWRWNHPGLRKLGNLMFPALLASIAMQINLIINTSFASSLTDPVRGGNGPVSWLAFALRFVQFPMGIFAVALASAMLPSISRSAAARNFNEFRTTLSRSLALVFLLTVPASLVLIVLGRPIIGAIYQSGHFQAYDTQQTAMALSCYAAGLVSFAAARLLIPAYYALSDSRMPMYLSVLSIFFNVSLPLFLLNVLHMNFAAMALTTSLAMSLEALLLFEGMRRKLGGLEGRYLADRFMRVFAATMTMALPLALLDHQFAVRYAPVRTVFIIELAILVPIAIGLFMTACKLFAVRELSTALHLVYRLRSRATEFSKLYR